MNIDFLPISSLALESLGGPVHAASQPQTLTLQLALAPRKARQEGMSGTARGGSDLAVSRRGRSLRAAVVPADGTPLTITF